MEKLSRIPKRDIPNKVLGIVRSRVICGSLSWEDGITITDNIRRQADIWIVAGRPPKGRIKIGRGLSCLELIKKTSLPEVKGLESTG